MTFTIGRFDLTNYGESIKSVSEDGGKVSISGSTALTTFDQANVLRQQLLGYVNNPDEAFVPFVWSDQPELSGYYSVTGAGFEEAGTGSALEGVWNFDVDMERVQNFAAPVIEIASVGAVRANSVSVAAPTRKIAYPGLAQNVILYTAPPMLALMRSPDHANATSPADAVYLLSEPSANFDGQSAVQYTIAPGSFYTGASSVLLDSNLIVGRYSLIPQTTLTIPNTITLSNGQFEIRFLSSSSTFQFQTRSWDGSAWTGYQTYTLSINNGTNFALSSPRSLLVMRNSPEQVTVRMRTNGALGTGQLLLDVGLRRGDYHATFKSDVDFAQLYVTTANATGGTPLGSYGYNIGSSTGSGPKYFCSTVPFNTGAQFSQVSITQTWQFAVGFIAPNGPVESVSYSSLAYYWASSQRQWVVAS